MKKIYKIFLMAIAILLGSCTSDPIQPQPEEPEPENNEIENSYYVRFDGESDTYNYSTTWSMVAGKFKYSTKGRNCSETFGPISKNDQIRFSGTYGSSSASIKLKIYVSRNNEPFALVGSSSGMGGASLTYTIDF